VCNFKSDVLKRAQQLAQLHLASSNLAINTLAVKASCDAGYATTYDQSSYKFFKRYTIPAKCRFPDQYADSKFSKLSAYLKSADDEHFSLETRIQATAALTIGTLTDSSPTTPSATL
jgi:hypothetical protein